jgi:DsbC/DsbD-like thiol-disulfide interchange protein
MARNLLSLALCLAALPAAAELPRDIATAALLGGWREQSGQHVAALRLTLAPGWKTYWRAPGEAGIPPAFDWSGSRNVAAVTPVWPLPHVFWQNGLRSVGYGGEVILPLLVSPVAVGEPILLSGRVEIGICEDVCIPVSFDLTGELPVPGAPDRAIAGAISAQPLPAGAAGVTSVTCAVEPIADGIRVTAAIAMPALGEEEEAVVELADPAIWISEAESRREGGVLFATAEMVPPNGRPFAVDRSEIRITVLAGARGVDIRGCAGR